MATHSFLIWMTAVSAFAQVRPAAPNPSGRSTAYQQAAGLPARITDFKAQPETIQPGQSATLIWATENPSGVTLDQGIGRVTARGSRQVSPNVTTTYTLTVRGPNNTTLTKSVTVTVPGTQPATAPVETAKKEVPRTAGGQPDLTGVYNFSGGGGGRGGNAPAGPVLKAGAEKFKIVRGPEDAGATSDCMPLAGPQAFGVPYQFQIIQNPNFVVILHEYPGTHRIIPTNGATHPVDPDPTWMGDSVGRWEGDTLVVDTVGFNDKTEIGGYKHTEALHLVERFRRSDYDTIQYEATLDDPNVFEKPWTMTRSFSLRPDLVKIDEFVCENNRDYTKLFGK
jgi:hypothetical protein